MEGKRHLMLAHLEEVRHVHPHPAGMPWEAVVLGVVVLLVVAVVAGATVRRTTASGLTMASVEDAPAGDERGEGADDE
jgi:hypothetical protein